MVDFHIEMQEDGRIISLELPEGMGLPVLMIINDETWDAPMFVELGENSTGYQYNPYPDHSEEDPMPDLPTFFCTQVSGTRRYGILDTRPNDRSFGVVEWHWITVYEMELEEQDSTTENMKVIFKEDLTYRP